VTRTAERVRGLGWHLRLHFFRGTLMENAERLMTIRNIPLVADHLGYPDPALGAADPACRFIVERLKADPNWWVMLSNGNRISAMDKDWDDAIPIARAYIEAAPDRVIWGSDWPHVQWRKAAYDERQRGGGAALSLRRQRQGAHPENPGRQSGTAARVWVMVEFAARFAAYGMALRA
jgi:predicted TIM-barrel fold metal-dependent hydrolase